MSKKFSLEEWMTTYKPIQNPLNKSAPFNGKMFEPYGTEEEFVTSQDRNRIWTYTESEDDGNSYILNGWRAIKDIGYFVTEVAFLDDENIEILVFEYPDDEDWEED